MTEVDPLDEVGEVCGISYAVEGAGLLVALVRGIVRDLIAEFVGVLAARLPQWLAEEGLTLVLATPLVVGQVATLVAKWVDKIQHFVRGLLNSLRRLHPMLDDLAGLFTKMGRRESELSRTDPAHPGVGEFRSDFPTGADDFVDDGQGISESAAVAYRGIRNSPEDVPVVAANTGLHPRIIDGMHQSPATRRPARPQPGAARLFHARRRHRRPVGRRATAPWTPTRSPTSATWPPTSTSRTG